ncbi:MAG: hypothetical protein ACYCPT_02075 [Acidimicrobiales bacterium]
MTSPVFANSGAVQPVAGAEVACCSIAGGPYAAIDAFVSGGTAGVQLEFRLYATVGTLRTLAARAVYAGPPVGAIPNQGSILEWVVINEPMATSPIVAGGTEYDLSVFVSASSVPGAQIQATLAGTNTYDPSVDQSAAVALPSNYGSTTVATNVGCAALADVGANLTNLAAIAFDIYASCGAGSVEALVISEQAGGADGFSNVVRQAALPVATQYRLAVREIQGTKLAGNVTASLATYAAIIPSPSAAGGSGTAWQEATGAAPAIVIPASTTTQGVYGVGMTGAGTVELPAAPSATQAPVTIADLDGSAIAHGLTIQGNGNNILGPDNTSAATYDFSAANGYAAGATITLQWIAGGGANVWKVMG